MSIQPVSALVAAIIILAFASSAAHAQSYPSKPITFIIPFAAGGDSDLSGRNVAAHASKYLNNQPIVRGVNNPSYLAPGDSYLQNVNVVLPIDAQGLWYVYIVPDGTGAHHHFAMPEASRFNLPFTTSW